MKYIKRELNKGIKMKEYLVKVEDDVTEWFFNGKRHREDGPAVEYSNGDKVYYINGKRHREDGPAVEFSDGDKEYYINGKCHREDGPAIEYSDGTKEYWINGKYYSYEDWKK
jgi:hypothetical protein